MWHTRDDCPRRVGNGNVLVMSTKRVLGRLGGWVSAGPRGDESGPSRHRGGPQGLEPACKPDSVPPVSRRRWPSISDGRLRPPRAAYPEAASASQPRRAGNPCLLLGLAPDGVYPAAPVARHAGELLPHPFTLTRRRSPGRSALCCTCRGSPRLEFLQRPALWSPDFPRPGVATEPRPPGRLSPSMLTRDDL